MKFMHFLFKRLREPSSWAGLSATILGVGQLGQINEAPAVAQTVAAAGEVAVTQSPIMGVAALLTGLLAVFSREKGEG